MAQARLAIRPSARRIFAESVRPFVDNYVEIFRYSSERFPIYPLANSGLILLSKINPYIST
jgi:hypothetical protein